MHWNKELDNYGALFQNLIGSGLLGTLLFACGKHAKQATESLMDQVLVPAGPGQHKVIRGIMQWRKFWHKMLLSSAFSWFTDKGRGLYKPSAQARAPAPTSDWAKLVPPPVLKHDDPALWTVYMSIISRYEALLDRKMSDVTLTTGDYQDMLELEEVTGKILHHVNILLSFAMVPIAPDDSIGKKSTAQ